MTDPEHLDEQIRLALDYLTGWCGAPMTLEQRVDLAVSVLQNLLPIGGLPPTRALGDRTMKHPLYVHDGVAELLDDKGLVQRSVPVNEWSEAVTLALNTDQPLIIRDENWEEL